MCLYTRMRCAQHQDARQACTGMPTDIAHFLRDGVARAHMLAMPCSRGRSRRACHAMHTMAHVDHAVPRAPGRAPAAAHGWVPRLDLASFSPSNSRSIERSQVRVVAPTPLVVYAETAGSVGRAHTRSALPLCVSITMHSTPAARPASYTNSAGRSSEAGGPPSARATCSAEARARAAQTYMQSAPELVSRVVRCGRGRGRAPAAAAGRRRALRRAGHVARG